MIERQLVAGVGVRQRVQEGVRGESLSVGMSGVC